MLSAGTSPAATLDTSTPGAPAGYVPQETWLQNLAMAVEIVMPSLALVFTLLRAHIRIQSKTIGADDYCIFAAMMFSIAQGVAASIYVKLAYMGIHIWEIPPHDPIPPGIWAWIAIVLYNPILALVKISVLAFLLRLASVKPAVRLVAWVLIVFTAVLMVAICLTVLGMCQPIQYNWDSTVAGGHCLERRPFALATAGLAIFTDFTTLAIPFWIFLGLRINRKAKFAILAVFALGIVVTAVGVVRLVLLARRYNAKPSDPTFDITYIISSFENNLAIVAACGPALWPLARRMFPRLFSGLGLSRGYQGDIEHINTTGVIEFTATDTNHSFRSRFSRGTVVNDKAGDSRNKGSMLTHNDDECQCGLHLEEST